MYIFICIFTKGIDSSFPLSFYFFVHMRTSLQSF